MRLIYITIGIKWSVAQAPSIGVHEQIGPRLIDFGGVFMAIFKWRIVYYISRIWENTEYWGRTNTDDSWLGMVSPTKLSIKLRSLC